jgi:hypothetical protein
MRPKSGHFLGALTFMATIAIFGLAVMFLWNALLPSIFGLPAVNYWQAAGFLVLARIFFGGIGGRFSHNTFAWRNPILDRWHGMTKSERDDFVKKHYHGYHEHHLMDNSPKDGETSKE